MSSALPVILCGQTERVATSVIAGLNPEYEVIHLTLSQAAGCAQIPLLLSGKSAPSDSELGSKNYSKVPIAVITGAGYNTEAVDAMMKAVAENRDAKHVPWLRPDTSKPAPPLGPEYGKAMVERVKECLGGLTGTEDMGEMKVHFF